MKKWQCVVCGLIYDEAKGWPEEGIEAGTRWEDVPEDWLCPDCGVGKLDFEMSEEGGPGRLFSCLASGRPGVILGAWVRSLTVLPGTLGSLAVGRPPTLS